VSVFLSHFLCLAWRCFFSLVFSHIHKRRGPGGGQQRGGGGGEWWGPQTGTYQVPNWYLPSASPNTVFKD
jgi:hypothetical protein